MKELVGTLAAARVAFARVVFASKIMTNVREAVKLAQLVVMRVRVLTRPIGAVLQTKPVLLELFAALMIVVASAVTLLDQHVVIMELGLVAQVVPPVVVIRAVLMIEAVVMVCVAKLEKHVVMVTVVLKAIVERIKQNVAQTDAVKMITVLVSVAVGINVIVPAVALLVVAPALQELVSNHVNNGAFTMTLFQGMAQIQETIAKAIATIVLLQAQRIFKTQVQKYVQEDLKDAQLQIRKAIAEMQKMLISSRGLLKEDRVSVQVDMYEQIQRGIIKLASARITQTDIMAYLEFPHNDSSLQIENTVKVIIKAMSAIQLTIDRFLHSKEKKRSLFFSYIETIRNALIEIIIQVQSDIRNMTPWSISSFHEIELPKVGGKETSEVMLCQTREMIIQLQAHLNKYLLPCQFSQEVDQIEQSLDGMQTLLSKMEGHLFQIDNFVAEFKDGKELVEQIHNQLLYIQEANNQLPITLAKGAAAVERKILHNTKDFLLTPTLSYMSGLIDTLGLFMKLSITGPVY